MDLPSQEVEIPMPLNSAYAHGHVTNMIHHQHDEEDAGHGHGHEHPSPPSQFQAPTSPMPMAQSHDHHNHHSKKQQVRYRECLKNHAASMGGNATDGCGEFMPSGEEGTIESLTCSACNCHRNFHRKEVEGEISSLMYDYHHHHHHHGSQVPPHHHLMINSRGRKVINLGHHKNMLYPGSATAGALVPAGGGGPRSVPMIPYSMGPLLIPSDQSDDQEELGGAAASGGVPCRALPPPPQYNQNQYYLHHHNQMLKKRFRTKFTPEQKEKMLSFAERVGWKIQKQEESVVQQFCQEIGVKRRVLKVWMHNNKHNLAKKNSAISDA